MGKDNVFDLNVAGCQVDPLTEILRSGARQLIQAAIQVELQEFLAQYQDRRLEDGRFSVVRNGHHPQREIQTGIGPVTVQVPKVRAKDGTPVVCRSALVPPYVRKSQMMLQKFLLADSSC